MESLTLWELSICTGTVSSTEQPYWFVTVTVTLSGPTGPLTSTVSLVAPVNTKGAFAVHW